MRYQLFCGEEGDVIIKDFSNPKLEGASISAAQWQLIQDHIIVKHFGYYDDLINDYMMDGWYDSEGATERAIEDFLWNNCDVEGVEE